MWWWLALALALAGPVERAGARSDAPLVVALHGRGDTPENFSHVAERLGPTLHWQFLRGPLAWRPDLQGSQWFDRQSPDGGRAALDAALQAVSVQVQAAGRKPVALMGFSQGCMVAAHYAARHPDAVRAVLCVGGMLIAPVRVPAGRHKVKVRFVHGSADTMVPIAKAREAVAALQAAGLDATLTEHAGGHVIPPQLAPELRMWLEAQLK